MSRKRSKPYFFSRDSREVLADDDGALGVGEAGAEAESGAVREVEHVEVGRVGGDEAGERRHDDADEHQVAAPEAVAQVAAERGEEQDAAERYRADPRCREGEMKMRSAQLGESRFENL